MSKTEINPADYKINDSDTGSADYQVALLTQRILDLTEHLKEHKKDRSCRRGITYRKIQRIVTKRL